MRLAKRALLAALLILVALLVVLFVLDNLQPVSVLLLGWQSPALPIATLLILAFLAGVIVGPLLAGLVVRCLRPAGRSSP
ncbi:hypothetical protein SF06_34160 [Pseudomonas flexibilis]|uniref:Lipopolysaccharide assembly protein A domain-containing protein n=1 Tax=Pseudomonas flexibilis TaxID=706570 RepID=A0A1N7B6E6_9PSED|nr:lipopolysaccharide assembly protein LapA domain-containing protein [Pseudomonas flexibilis]KHL67834.1 hypothetical protein SF06_34160 [Pseudomonas flexibilis]SIR46935.1 Protein of unknown function [Pseudomonas flexibilis]